MKIKGLYLHNFRNYGLCSLQFPAMVNIFYGKNAQGKTNLLEAIFYAAFGMSHRTFQEDDLFGDGRREMAVKADFTSFDSDYEIKIKRYEQNGRIKKELLLDNVNIKAKEHYGTLNTVMFSPEDLQLIKGEPQLRRRFFDMQIAQTDKAYYELLVKYNRLLQQRNRLLKEIRDNDGDKSQLNLWNNELSASAARIIKKRLAALEELLVIASGIYASIAGGSETMLINYALKTSNDFILQQSDKSENEWQEFYLKELHERQALDIMRGNTSIGPHRDDLFFYVSGKLLKAFGSQGQQRSAALALKLAQLEYVKNNTGEYPVLLLDDVMSELDSERRTHLLKFIDGRVQTFITVNDKHLIPDLNNNAYFYIENGKVMQG
ncbi:DNA replication/repair protein RecF [Phascolarctobacterium sp. ET69]|uniref:DNA replication/repair protein RecF n=1 Tax=Phascolarctobacterium sp. ET69 TaxID=2939420 RepID=UPI002010D4E8|nr:DNA replication/repair protein RecF [Phascolarctobacterium sp. ET69]MCL1604918.1 DNA replication/repair protein RecF [Phascolarctobacterium sp. ET69]